MAVVRSLGVGEGRKSAGMLTYRTVRGRTIASQRIVTNTSNTPKQAVQRSYFGSANRAMLYLLGWISVGFEKSKYGSERNNFLKTNKYLDLWAETLTELETGSLSVFDFMLYGFEPFEITTPKGRITTPGYRKVSVGSAGGCVPSAGAAMGKEALPSDIQKTVLRSAVYFDFPGGMLGSRVSIDVVVIVKDAAPVVNHYDADNLPDSITTGVMFKVNQTSGLVDTLKVNNSGSDYNDTQAIIIPVVRIDDKIVTNEYAVLTEKPAPGA